jgi:uncharacterized protein
MISEKVKNDIINALKPISPDRVILFGSHAYGEPSKDSDIDLLVVTADDFLPENFKEATKVHLNVSKRLLEMQKEIPMDIIVHTRPMFKKFIELDSMFSRKIMKDGIFLI